MKHRKKRSADTLLDWGLPITVFAGLLGSGIALISMPGPIRVIDGDTIERGGINYRLVGFDTPETFHAKCDEERELGEAASRRLADLIEAGHAHVDPVTDRRDRYGRGLARLLINGRDVGEILISEGLARPYDGRSRRTLWCSTDDR